MKKLCARLSIGIVPRRLAIFAVLLAATQALHSATTVQDASALKLPAGARVALVEFADLECPACAQANPMLVAAADKYKIPLVRHDLLIPSHNWSRTAAINAHWFELQKKGLGDEYRNQVFASQSSIFNPMMLRQFTQSFAQSHGITIPFDMDPGNKLANEVEADNQLSRRTGVTMTPTIFIVTAGASGPHYEEVVDHGKLFQLIDEALEKTKGATTRISRK